MIKRGRNSLADSSSVSYAISPVSFWKAKVTVATDHVYFSNQLSPSTVVLSVLMNKELLN